MAPVVLLAILAAQTCGGLASILTKLSLDGFAPWMLVFARQLIGLGILFAVAAARRRTSPATSPATDSPIRFDARDGLLLVTAAWGGFALPQALLAVGIERSTGTMGALLTPLEPIGIVVGGLLFLGERLTTARGIALLLGSFGAMLVVGQGHIDPSLGDPIGDATIAAGHLSWAIYTVAAKPLLERHDPMRVTIRIVLLSLVPMAALAASEPFDLAAAIDSAPYLVALALTGTVLGTWTWNFALGHVTAGTMAMFIFVQPLVGLVAGSLWLGEPAGASALAGAGIIAAAVAIGTHSRKATR